MWFKKNKKHIVWLKKYICYWLFVKNVKIYPFLFRNIIRKSKLLQIIPNVEQIALSGSKKKLSAL